VSEVAVLVPTVHRAEMLVPLAANIARTTESPHRIYFVVEKWDADSIREAKRVKDAVLVAGEFGSNARAVNGGYRASREPFLAILNDDIRCTPGWDTAALAHMSDTTHIVGINQGNGQCQSFSMVRRAYIQEHSGVFDEPDTLYHEYLSQYPDTEFAQYAQRRGVWEDAPDAVIQHLHWTFGLSDGNHPNYVKARDTFAVDHQAYTQRLPHFA
jgi:hypothetical protein